MKSNEESVFSKEYVDEVKTGESVLASANLDINTAITIEVERYGVSKPKRVIVKAKISHD